MPVLAVFRQMAEWIIFFDVRILTLGARPSRAHALIVHPQRIQVLLHAPVHGLCFRQLNRSWSARSARLRFENKRLDKLSTTLVTIGHTICIIAVTVSSVSTGVRQRQYL